MLLSHLPAWPSRVFQRLACYLDRRSAARLPLLLLGMLCGAWRSHFPEVSLLELGSLEGQWVSVRELPRFGQAITLSVQKNIEFSRMIFQTLGGLFTRETSPKQLMGPVAIAQLSGESAQLGWIALLGRRLASAGTA